MSPVTVSGALLRALSIGGDSKTQRLVSRKRNVSSPIIANYEDTFRYGLIQELEWRHHLSLFPLPPAPRSHHASALGNLLSASLRFLLVAAATGLKALGLSHRKVGSPTGGLH